VLALVVPVKSLTEEPLKKAGFPQVRPTIPEAHHYVTVNFYSNTFFI